MSEANLRMRVSVKDEASGPLSHLKGEVQGLANTIKTFNQGGGLGGGSLSGLASGLPALAKGAGLAGAALAVLNGPIRSNIAAAAEDAATVAQLEQAIKNAEGSLVTYGAALEQTASRAERLGFTDEEARRSLALLVAQTGSAAEANSRFAIAQDLARGASIELATASRLVGRITEENVNALSRYGVTIAKGSSETEALAAVQQKFAGQAKAFGDSSAGTYANLGIAISNIGEAAGRAIDPLAQVGAKILTFGAGVAADTIDSMAGAFWGLIGAAGKGLELFTGLGGKAKETDTAMQEAAQGTDMFTLAQEQAAKSAEVLNAMLEKQVNSLDVSKMGFESSVAGIQSYIQGAEALIATFGELSKSQIDYLTGATTATGALNTRASGGPVMAGGSYLVGERGPELFQPRSSGSIVSNSQVNNNQRSLAIYGNVTINAGGRASKDDADLLLRRI